MFAFESGAKVGILFVKAKRMLGYLCAFNVF